MDFSYQDSLVENIYKDLHKKKPVVLAACPSAGKTRMGLKIVKRVLKDFPGEKALVFTHGQVILRDQWHETVVENFKGLKTTVVMRGSEAPAAFRKSDLILSLPQTLRKANLGKVAKIKLVVIDEAHQRFLAREMQELLAQLQPDFILLLTGTPSAYINNPGYIVHGITIEELLDYGVVSDPLLEIVVGDDPYTIKDFDPSTWELIKSLKKGTTEATLDKILPQILRKLTSSHRTNPERFDWIGEVKSWKQLAEKLQKSMVICNDQKHAEDVYNYFTERGVSSVLSISNLNDGVEEVEKFKNDPNVRLFIVVNRGNMGFSYEELINLIDLSGTLNVNRLFQMICRLIRVSKQNPKEKKLFIKVTNEDLHELAFSVMSFVVALSTKRHYYSYTTQYRIDKILEIPVPVKFMDHLDEHLKPKRKGLQKSIEDLPHLFTFTEIKKANLKGTIAYTNLKTVIDRIYKQKDLGYELKHLEDCIKKCKTRKEFKMEFPSEYKFIQSRRLNYLLNNAYGERSTWNRVSVIDAARQCLNFNEFREKYIGAYNWAKRNKMMKEIKDLYNFTPKELDIKSKDELIHKILEDNNFEVTETGGVFYEGIRVKPKFRRGLVPYFVYKQDRFRINVPIPRLVYTKFNGPVPENKVIAFRVMDKKSPTMSSLRNLYLVNGKPEGEVA